jgi:hypothetical protein
LILLLRNARRWLGVFTSCGERNEIRSGPLLEYGSGASERWTTMIGFMRSSCCAGPQLTVRKHLPNSRFDAPLLNCATGDWFPPRAVAVTGTALRCIGYAAMAIEFRFTPELHLRDGRVIRDLNDAIGFAREQETRPGVDQRDEVLHVMERATTREQAHAAAHRFLHWLEELEVVE